MTVRELIEKLQELGPMREDCPVMFESDKYEYDIEEISFNGHSVIYLSDDPDW
jgi:hypothetical protein